MGTRTAPRPGAGAPPDIHAPAVPRLVAGLVRRPRLFALLDRGASGPVTLICAPAGSGKTMLLSSWLRSTDLPGAVAWVGVERNESDATRFWGMVIDALRRSGAVARDDPLATLAPAPLGGQGEFVQRLLEGLGRLSQTVFLVLDDLHQLQSDVRFPGDQRAIRSSFARLRLQRCEVDLDPHHTRDPAHVCVVGE